MRVCINGKVWDTRNGDLVTLELTSEVDRNLLLGTVLVSQHKRVTVNVVSEHPSMPGEITAEVAERNGRALGANPGLFNERETDNAWRFVDRLREGAKR